MLSPVLSGFSGVNASTCIYAFCAIACNQCMVFCLVFSTQYFSFHLANLKNSQITNMNRAIAIGTGERAAWNLSDVFYLGCVIVTVMKKGYGALSRNNQKKW